MKIITLGYFRSHTDASDALDFVASFAGSHGKKCYGTKKDPSGSGAVAVYLKVDSWLDAHAANSGFIGENLAKAAPKFRKQARDHAGAMGGALRAWRRLSTR